MAFETGRHIIGYEVDKVRAAVDWFTRPGEPKRPIGVVGFGEGGLIAFYAAAVDTRIDAAWVGGYFGPREGVWQEPIYRNVWGLLDEFGDAEIGSLIAPRGLVIEACRAPRSPGLRRPRAAGRNTAAPGSSDARRAATRRVRRPSHGPACSGPGGSSGRRRVSEARRRLLAMLATGRPREPDRRPARTSTPAPG